MKLICKTLNWSVTSNRKNKKKNESRKKFNSKALQLLNIYFRNTVTPSFPLISKANLASSKNKSRRESREFFSPIDTTSFQSNRGGLPFRLFTSRSNLSNFRSKQFSKDDGKITARKSWGENGVRRAKRYSALSRDQIRRFSSSSMTREGTRVPLCRLMIFEWYRLSSIWSMIKCRRWTSFRLVTI